jgi:hypothetical protein
VKDIDTVDFFANQNRVMDLYLKGETNATKIANITGFKRKDVIEYIEQWKSVARNDKDVKERAKEALAGMDQHYDIIIKRLWETVEQADEDGDVKTKTTTLKAIADVESKRQESLQKAGLYDDAELGDEIAMMQEQADKIKQLLTLVASKYPESKMDILEGLQEIFAQEPIAVPDVVRGEINV